MSTSVLRYNDDKPHRCPVCHAVTVDTGNARHTLSTGIVTCCRCDTRFTRWPWLSPVLFELGVVCSEHRKS